jgi:hypothetical protein
LMASRDQSRSNLLSQAILADEQRKFDTLGLNRQTGLGAINAGAGLATGLGNAYNPSALFGANADALSGLLNVANSGTQAGFQGLNTAGNLANIMQESLPSSFRNTLLAALLNTGMSVATPDNLASAGRYIWDGLKWVVRGGGNTGTGSTTVNSNGTLSPTNPGVNVGTPPFNGTPAGWNWIDPAHGWDLGDH